MDTDIEELKEMVRTSNKLAEDTNRVVHNMRNAARWSRVFSFVWWAVVLGASGYAYYYFLWPYLGQLMQLYGNAQNIFQNFRPGQ